MSGIKHCAARVACLAGLVALPASAIQCGDVITTNTVLTADLGPCPGNGLIIGREGVTLNLNGYRITGTGTGGGAGVLLMDGLATIQGPGVIEKFSIGIKLPQLQLVHNVTIRHITFEGNGQGIGITQSSTVLIMDNDLRNGGEGIHLVEAVGITIQGNRITGNTGPGIYYSLTGNLSILDNTINENQVGITPFREPGPVTIRGNTVSRNRGNGIEFIACAIVAENNASHNGGSGIVNVALPFQLACPIQENIAMHNSIYGIAILGGSGFRVTDNLAMQNPIDLFDGTSGNCWSDNKFKTSQPAVLPACN